MEQCHNLVANNPKSNKCESYSPQLAMVYARIIANINARVTAEGASFGQQYMLQKGLKKWSTRGANAATKEVDQLHQRNCFSPIDVSKLTRDE